MDGNSTYAGADQSSGLEFSTGDLNAIECAEKVEAMVTTALLHQEDVWNMLMNLFPDNISHDSGSGRTENQVKISASPQVLRAIKSKVENSMDWCRLAQCRLKGLQTTAARMP